MGVYPEPQRAEQPLAGKLSGGCLATMAHFAGLQAVEDQEIRFLPLGSGVSETAAFVLLLRCSLCCNKNCQPHIELCIVMVKHLQ